MTGPKLLKKNDKDVLDHLGDLITEVMNKRRRSGRSLEDRWTSGVRKMDDILHKNVEDIVKEILASAKKNAKIDDDDDAITYVKALIDDIGVAAVTPSSKYVIRRILKAMNLKQAKVVIEYGPAAGVITRRILPELAEDAKLIAIEQNERLFAVLQRTADPRLFPVCGDVRQLPKILAGLGIAQADVIVSGVPFSHFRPRARHELLLQTSEILRPGGRFVAYQVTTHLIPLLADYFSRVDTQFELRNIPPHFVFTAEK